MRLVRMLCKHGAGWCGDRSLLRMIERCSEDCFVCKRAQQSGRQERFWANPFPYFMVTLSYIVLGALRDFDERAGREGPAVHATLLYASLATVGNGIGSLSDISPLLDAVSASSEALNLVAPRLVDFHVDGRTAPLRLPHTFAQPLFEGMSAALQRSDGGEDVRNIAQVMIAASPFVQCLESAHWGSTDPITGDPLNGEPLPVRAQRALVDAVRAAAIWAMSSARKRARIAL